MAEAGKPSAGAIGVDTMAEEKQRPSLIQRVETMTSVIELLLETLADLSVRELEKFKTVLSQSDLYRRLYWRHLKTDMQDTVFLMVLTYGQQSVETTKQVLKKMKMKRTDQVQILSDSSSGNKKKHSVDEHLSALIHKVATMRAFKELLLETLRDLSNVELKKFKWLLKFTFFQRSLELISWIELSLPHISWGELESTDITDQLVDMMLERCSQQSVEVTKEVLMDMNRTDLVQRLSETSSGHKGAGSSAEAFGVRTTEGEKHYVDEHWPALIRKVDTMTSVIELLLETLAGLSDGELEEFRDVLLSQTDFYRRLLDMTLILREIVDWQATVFLMVLTYGQQSVETTKQVLKKMKRIDLVQRLSDSSKGPKKQHSDEHRPALIQKVATMAAVNQLLLETLNDLSDKELKKFKWSLEWIVSQKNVPDISPVLSYTTYREEIVDVMLRTYSQQSVQLTRQVVKKMNRTDLMQRLSKPSSELKEEHSVDEHQPAVLERAAVKQILLETLKDLSYEELEKFKWLLQFTQFQKGLPHISLSRLQWTDSAVTLVDLMVQTCGQQSVEVTKEVFMDMNRTDLVNKLSVISSKIKEKHSSELLQKEVIMTPLMEKLLETLEYLRPLELGDFKHALQRTRMEKGLPEISRQRMDRADRVGMLKLMVEIYGEQSVEVTREVLMEMERIRREREEMKRRMMEEMKRRMMEEMKRRMMEGNRRDRRRFSFLSFELKEKHPSEPLQKEVTKTTLMEKLLETLEDLSPGELEKFKHVLQYTKMGKDLPKIPGHQMETADKVKIVELMVKIYGQQSVEVTCKVLRKMNRIDLAEMLSGTSSGLKEKHQSKPLQKVVTRTSLMEKLLETLKDLSYGELEQFKHLLQCTTMKKDLPKISSQRMEMADRDEIVELMVEIYGEQSVEVTREVLMEMNRTDLAEGLPEISSGSKEKQRPSLIQRVETMTSVIELLLETLAGLSDGELEEFKEVLLSQTDLYRRLSGIPMMLLRIKDRQATVFLMVLTYGQQSVEMTKEVLEKMKRTDLVQRLSDSSSGPKNEHRSALIQKVATMAAVKQLLLETLNDLSDKELKKFKWSLEWIVSQKNLPDSSTEVNDTTDSEETVDVMLQTYSQQSVQLTREVVKKMNRTDLMQRLSKPSSELKEKHSVDEHQPAVLERVATMRAFKELLLETLSDLSNVELKKFKWLLKFTFFQRSLELISWREQESTYTTDKLVDVMLERCGQQSVEVTKEVLMDMNRTDLVQRLPETSSGHKGKIKKTTVTLYVDTMTSVIELLLETLAGLSDGELEEFKEVLLSQTDLYRHLSGLSFILREIEDQQVTVFLIVLTYGQQSVEMTKQVLKKMKMTDLVQRLSDSSKGPKRQHSDEHRPALIQKAATMAAVKQLLLETLNDFSDKELKKFKWSLEWIVSQKNLPDFSPELSDTTDRAKIVDVMLQTYSQQSVQLTREVVKKMNRTDLMQRLSKPSSELKEKHSVDEHQLAAAVKQILLETLQDLSDKELENFKWLLRFTQFQKGLPHISLSRLHRAGSADTLVDLMVQTCGQQSVEVTKEVFMDMNRTDLVNKLSVISSRITEKHPSELLQREVTMTLLMEKLLETLEDLSQGELEDFRRVLQRTRMKKGLPEISTQRMWMASRVGMLKLMVAIDGQQSVEVTREVLMEMESNRREREEMKRMEWEERDFFSPFYFGLKEEHPSEPLQKEVTKTPLMEKLLETLEDLSPGELKKFKCHVMSSHVLQYTKMEKDLPKIPGHQMETADRVKIVGLMVKIYGQQSVEVTCKVLKKMNRTDLAERLSGTSSGLKGKMKKTETEILHNHTSLAACWASPHSSDWTNLDPEVNYTDANEAPIYSLQSGAGNFECSVSGLRWVCKEKVSFKYQFCSLSGHFERIESMKYMPAGPLMDITVIAGKLDVVYLPHWICIDDNPTILDKFAVLHIDDCGDAVEKVSEVTSSHVKLSDPDFSLLLVLLDWLGLPVEIYCMVLIYSKILTASSQASLTLHVYLIPSDLGLQEELDSREKSYGFKGIQKPKPEKSLKMQNWFTLTTDQEGAEIYPEGEKPQTLKLRYDSTGPNFYEVVVKNPDKDFKLMLTPENGHQPVWTCKILQGEWQSTGRIQEKHSVDKHQEAADGKRLFKMLKELTDKEFKEFKWYLLRISKCQRQNTDRVDLVDLMLQTYTQESVGVAKDILKEIGRNDLVQLLSDTSSGSEAAGSSA
ncbi:hypothetical protein ABVT39_014808 [Epinephelus coioides]